MYSQALPVLCVSVQCAVGAPGTLPGDATCHDLGYKREETSWVHQGQEFELELEAKERRWATAKTRRETKRSIRSQRSASRKAG